MAIVLKDRVKETAAAPGTGTITLGGAASGFQAFSAIGNGNVTYFAIVDANSGAWEVNYGTYTSSGTTLTRSTPPLSSSNAGALVNFTGAVEVFCTYPSEKAIYEETSGSVLIDGGPITVLGENVTVNPALEAELGKFVGNVDSFGQVYNFNQNDGSNASADFVVYNDQTTDGFTHFTDMGINSSNYSSVDYPLFTPGSGYVFHEGDDFFIGNQTANKDVVLFAGGVDTANVALTVSGTDLSVTLAGDLNVGGDLDVTGAATFGSTVTLSADPSLALQAATKQYVDNAVSTGIHVHQPVRVESAGALTVTYNNGTAGVGATLTNAGTQTALVLDGVTLSVNDRVLCYDQVDQTQNGVYVVTNVGSGSTNWVMTRASDADTYDPQNDLALGGGDYFYVQEGLTAAGESYVCTNEGTITFGTTNITFQQFSGSVTYTGGTNIDVTGQTISLTGTVAATNGGTGTSTVTTGDLLYGSATNTWSKLAKGSAYKSLVMNAGGTNVEWNAVALNQPGAVSGSLGEVNGGTGQNGYTLGDTLYSSAADTLARLPGNTTTTKKFLAQTGTGAASASPLWDTISGSDVNGNIAGQAGSVANALTAGTYLTSGGTYDGSAARTFAVDATSANTADKVVARDSSGNFSAGTITATLSGSATSATTATNLAGGAANQIPYQSSSGATSFAVAPSASGQVLSWNGSAFTYVAGTISGVPLGSNLSSLTAGTYLTGTAYNGSGAQTWAVDATTTNTASKVVARDASGNFSAGTITAALNGNATTATTATNVSGTVAIANGGTGSTSLTANNVLLGNGTSALQVVAPGTSGNVLTSDGTTWTSAAGLSLSGDSTWTGTQTFNGTSSKLAMVLRDAAETTTVSATAATGTINFDVTTQSVLYYTSNASANWTLNVRASSGTTLNTIMSTGQSMTIAFLVTNGATAYRQTGLQIDGSSVTPKWQGGTAPAAGNASSIDAYVVTVIKTGAAAFTVLASQTQFA